MIIDVWFRYVRYIVVSRMVCKGNEVLFLLYVELFGDCVIIVWLCIFKYFLCFIICYWLL